jgi:preprotein translocase subunit SecA
MLKIIGRLLVKLLGGSRNDRIIRGRLEFVRETINPIEPDMQALSDEDLLDRSLKLREAFQSGRRKRNDILPEAYAIVREASRRAQHHRHFDVQLVAGKVLDEGWIAEEATGEGKTIACYPAIYMAWLEGMNVHLVTTNDYLVRVGAEFAKPVFERLGVTVGYITSDMPAYGAEAKVRRDAYACDVTYAINNELGFDYLRDNMKMSKADQVQGPLDFAIIDEIDSILIDEARTPLIISGPAYGDSKRYQQADSIARQLIEKNKPWDRANRRVETLKRELKSLDGEVSKASREEREKVEKQIQKTEAELEEAEADLANETQYFEVELDRKSAHMTHDGVGAAQEIAGVGSFYVGSNMDWPHLMEQALRAHLVYERDKDYVVQNGEVIIVDEFTGRLMHGRQWSDGLHQAVEAKERVRVKDETQTIATITFQNFFKLYKKLAGMTGTAMTEANEFMNFYNLDVADVPTHRPVNRVDHNDRIYADEDAKFRAIVEEVHDVCMTGRPVLVGTTSIEKSERISNMLTRSYGVEHNVLNGRLENAVRESEIVLNAGLQKPLKKDSKQMVGAVTIATNMAGRGTDIKLAEGVVYPNCRVPDDETLRELGCEPDPLYPAGVYKCCIHCEQYDPATNCGHCFKPKLDDSFPTRGRTDCREDVPCGLHIVGTERHEARRIDNQLRGRAGRQGDPGSSRFFLSLRDDLMAVFAGEWTLKVLSWLGLQGEASIEDKRVSKGIERAQRKVEERNFEMRKNLLEYDEIMDHQRHVFYRMRQDVLEGHNLEGMVLEMVHDSLDRAVAEYLDGDYHRRCIAEWVRQNLQVPIEAADIRANDPDDFDDLADDLRSRAKSEAESTISMTLGEYMDEDIPQKQWDLRGLASWAMSRFGVQISRNQLRKMSPQDVEEELSAAAAERIDETDFSPLMPLLEPNLAANALADWAKARFGLDVTADELGETPEAARRTLVESVEEAYVRRQIEYPVEHVMDMTIGQHGAGNVYALQTLAEWANRKYQAGWSGEDLQHRKPREIYEDLVAMSETWQADGKLAEAIRQGLGSEPTVEAAVEFARERFDTDLSAEDFEGDGDVLDRLRAVGERFLRREMIELERFVLLQICDSSWKDHLLNMDHLKGAIGLRGYAEQDPKVAFKREGGRMFEEMLAGIRDKVGDMIFKVRLSGESRATSVYQVSSAVHEQLQGYDHLARDMAEQQPEGGAEQQKVKQIVIDTPKVGRNDPCPCGSGKKYKKCCGANV